MFVELHKNGTEQPILINSSKVTTIHKRFIPDVLAPRHKLKEEGTQIFIGDDPEPFNIMESYDKVRDIFTNINIITGGNT